VEVKQEEKKLSDEAVKVLQEIKKKYEDEVINLRVKNQMLTQERDVFKANLDETVKENSELK
jgi:hypothetical protein